MCFIWVPKDIAEVLEKIGWKKFYKNWFLSQNCPIYQGSMDWEGPTD